MNYRHNGGPLGDGWIARHRSVRDHWLVGHGIHVKPADPSRKRCHTKGEAWEDLTMECRYEAATVNNGGKKMELRRGEMVGAVSWLANRWNWTPKTVRGFLDDLENDGMIELKNPASEKGNQIGRQSNVITVCNYDYYQNGSSDARPPEGQPQGHQGATTGQPEGNIYKDKQRNKGTREQEEVRAAAAALDEAFEQFWSAFPAERKRGKGKCRDLFAQIVSGRHKTRRATAAEIIAAVKAGNGIDPNFAPMPETWLNQGRWEDGAVNGGDPTPVNSMPWGWWRGKEDRLRNLSIDRWREGFIATKPNGTWPWWIFGPPPGHPECLVPDVIIQENNYLEIYRGQIHHD